MPPCRAGESRPGIGVGGGTSDMQNRALGMRAAVKSWGQPEPPVPDHVLAQRMRAKLGLYARHPSAIEVHVTDGGVVTLSGPVLKDEVDDICSAIQGMRGVSQIFNRMDRHASSQDVPVLQSAIGPKRGPRFAFMQTHWSPTARMAAALIGTAALLYGLSQRTVSATTLAASGLGLLLRSATNQEFARLLGWREAFERSDDAAHIRASSTLVPVGRG